MGLLRGIKTAFERLIPRSKFIRGVFVVAGGIVVSQGTVIISSPVLTRIYTPEEFGVLAVFTSVLSLTMTVAGMRYDMAIPLAGTDVEATNLVAVLTTLLVITGALLGLVILLTGDSLLHLTGIQSDAALSLLPVSVVISGFYSGLTYWATRKQSYKRISHAKIAAALTQILLQALIGLFVAGPEGLVFGYVTGHAVGTVILLGGAKDLGIRGISVTEMWAQAKEHRDFPKFTMWAALVSTAGLQLPVVVLSKHFGLEVSGLFSLTTKVLGVPVSLFSQAVGRVFYSEAARLRTSSPNPVVARVLVESVAASLWVVSITVFPLLALQAPFLFEFVFGPDWSRAGYYVRLLIPWFLLSFVSSPISTFPLVQGKQKHAFGMTMYETLLRLGAIYGGVITGLDSIAILLYGVAGGVISLVYIAWVLRLAGSSLGQWWSQVGPYTCAAALVTTILAFANNLASSELGFLFDLVVMGMFGIWIWRRLGLPKLRHIDVTYKSIN